MVRKKSPHLLMRKSAWIFYFIIGLILLFAVPFWLLCIAPILEKIPTNFSYTADIFSLDNFYDENIKKFEGENISKTQFSYNVIDIKNNFLIIKNTFIVKKLSDKPIFSVERIYDIDPYTGQHISHAGIENRPGYLFAPRHLHKQNFVYWHINYDAPAHMQYIDKVKIKGLTVYHYSATYNADQTANLKNLPASLKIVGLR